jgi:hypothetical protein
MAMPTNGSGNAVPLAIYPIGFELSSLVIFDPATGEWVIGKGYLGDIFCRQRTGFGSKAQKQRAQIIIQ